MMVDGSEKANRPAISDRPHPLWLFVAWLKLTWRSLCRALTGEPEPALWARQQPDGEGELVRVPSVTPFASESRGDAPPGRFGGRLHRRSARRSVNRTLYCVDSPPPRADFGNANYKR